jgi:hypothetical protein
VSARFVFHDAFAAGDTRFQDVRVLATDGDRIKIRFVTADDKAVDVILNKSEVRDMVTWDMLR